MSKGKTYVTITDKEDNTIQISKLYVHETGIITNDYYLGDCTGSIVIPISTVILLGYIILFVIKKYKEELNKNMYQYKNVAYLGLIIFLLFSFINQVFTAINYNGINSSIDSVITLSRGFSVILLPIAFIVSVLVTISNIILIKKEGFTLKNLLGLILGIMICGATIFPEILNNILQNATWIDVHSERGIWNYIQKFVEVSIYSVISYLECILLGTIILGIKSAKHIPKYDKDYIIILGCKIKKDGKLTNLLKARVDRAIEFSKMQKENTGKDIIFVPSGGKGEDEVIPEATAIKNYLLEQGVEEKNILVEDKSKNTFENIIFSNKIIKEKMEKAKVAFSTTNYHVFRAGCIATEQSINIEGIGAKTRRYFWINAFIREFIATLFSEKKKHLSIICFIILISILMIAILYLNNNI